MAGDGSERIVLAQWEERLRLVFQTAPEGTQRFVVEVLDTDGAIVESSSFTHDDFPLATGDYGARMADVLNPSSGSAAQVLSATFLALANADVEALETLFHEDYLHLDHRPLGYADADKTAMIASQVIQADMSAIWLAQTIATWNTLGGVSTGGYWTLNYGRWTPYEFGVHLGVVKNGQVLHAEIFPEDQLDAALTRFTELTSSLETDAERRGTGPSNPLSRRCR